MIGICEITRPVPITETSHRWEPYCPDRAIETWRYHCLCSHQIIRSTCLAHRPQPGQTGCRECLDNGHVCPVRAELFLGPN